MTYQITSQLFRYMKTYSVNPAVIGNLCSIFEPSWVVKGIKEDHFEHVGLLVLDAIKDRLETTTSTKFVSNVETALLRLGQYSATYYPKECFTVISGDIFMTDTSNLFSKVYNMSKEAMQLTYIESIRTKIISDLAYLQSRGLGSKPMSMMPCFTDYPHIDKLGGTLDEVLLYFVDTVFNAKDWRSCLAIQERIFQLASFVREVN